jgi:hypothetical protein
VRAALSDLEQASRSFDGRHNSRWRNRKSINGITDEFRRPATELVALEAIQSAFSANPEKSDTVLGERPDRRLHTALLAERTDQAVLRAGQARGGVEGDQRVENRRDRRGMARASGAPTTEPATRTTLRDLETASCFDSR